MSIEINISNIDTDNIIIFKLVISVIIPLDDRSCNIDNPNILATITQYVFLNNNMNLSVKNTANKIINTKLKQINISIVVKIFTLPF